MFNAKTYIDRRSVLKSQFDSGLLLFPGNSESPMNYPDNCYRFRQDSTFLYYFGIDHPDLVAIIDIDQNREILFGDDYTIDDVVWMGVQPTLAERANGCGIRDTYALDQVVPYLSKSIASGRKIHYLPPYRKANILKLHRWLNSPVTTLTRDHSMELVKAVISQRNYKTEEEVEEIEKAVNITVDMHLTAMNIARPGMKESEIAAAVRQVALAAGGDISFPVIATIHGETLHNHYHGNTLNNGDLFLLDAGAETTRHYAGDMSSTFPVDTAFTPLQRDIYEVALAAHEAAISKLKPGITNKEVHLTACRMIADGMKNLGFMKGDMETAVEAGAHALFFPCGTGHMMGLDVHDMEDLGEQWVGWDGEPKSKQFGLKSLRLGRELEPGFVLTIEPGVYFIPDLIKLWRKEDKFSDFLCWDKIEQYQGFGGCRNEEDFLITKEGARLLGKPLPKTIEDVEAMRRQ